mmetsp:Transcript_15651/g.51218  ORF Transcript_15651/g.51218 Transcript_15651/m.51218 type:complete len:231 (-) Transcript_15651:380-1072(-)
MGLTGGRRVGRGRRRRRVLVRRRRRRPGAPGGDGAGPVARALRADGGEGRGPAARRSALRRRRRRRGRRGSHGRARHRHLRSDQGRRQGRLCRRRRRLLRGGLYPPASAPPWWWNSGCPAAAAAAAGGERRLRKEKEEGDSICFMTELDANVVGGRRRRGRAVVGFATSSWRGDYWSRVSRVVGVVALVEFIFEVGVDEGGALRAAAYVLGDGVVGEGVDGAFDDVAEAG